MRTILLSLFVFLLVLPVMSQESRDLKRPPVTSVAHAAFYTKDVESARKFYKEFLGYAEPFSLMAANGTICEIVQYEPTSMSSKTLGKDMPETRISARMSHVGFQVPDLDKAISFYCSILGFKETWRGSRDGKNVTWVNLKLPESNDTI